MKYSVSMCVKCCGSMCVKLCVAAGVSQCVLTHECRCVWFSECVSACRRHTRPALGWSVAVSECGREVLIHFVHIDSVHIDWI